MYPHRFHPFSLAGGYNAAMSKTRRRLFRRHFFLPAEHGAWVWLLGPLIIGLAAAGRFPLPDGWLLLVAALAAFLLRQPASIIVKVLSKRRARQDFQPALFWLVLYSLVMLAATLGLLWAGHPRILWLAVPGVLVFLWHLWLVSRRAERGQTGVELVACGVLALAAPAAYWVAGGQDNGQAWALWGLTWLQSAASILYVALRLEGRRLKAVAPLGERLRMGGRTLLYHLFNLLAAAAAVALRLAPSLVVLAFGLMALDALEGVLRPPVGVRPTRIGFRQLAASTAFVILMSLAYLLA